MHRHHHRQYNSGRHHDRHHKQYYYNRHRERNHYRVHNNYDKLKIKEKINSHLKNHTVEKDTTNPERMITSDHARNIFEKWFQERSKLETGPYPDTETKTELAKQSNTTIVHVNRWFAQRRRTEKMKWLNGDRFKPIWLKKKGRPRKDI